MAKLKRCPKCGRDNRYRENITVEAAWSAYKYQCQHCGTHTRIHHTRQFARNEWNRLTGPWRKEKEEKDGV